MEYKQQLLKPNEPQEYLSDLDTFNIYPAPNGTTIRIDHPFWSDDEEDIRLCVSIKSKKIRKIALAPKFRYIPFPHDGHCLVQAELYLMTGIIYKDPVPMMKLLSERYPEDSRLKELANSEEHFQNLNMSNYQIPVLSKLAKLGPMVAAYDGHMYYCPLLAKNKFRSKDNEDHYVGSWDKRPIHFGHSYVLKRGTMPIRQDDTPVIKTNDPIESRPFGFIVQEVIKKNKDGKDIKCFVYIPPVEGDKCVPLSLAIGLALRCDYDFPEAASTITELLTCDEEHVYYDTAKNICAALKYTNGDKGMDLKEAVDYINSFGMKVLDQEYYDRGESGFYLYDSGNKEDDIHAIYVSQANLNVICDKGKDPLNWCAKEALVTSGLVKKISKEFEDYVSMLRSYNGFTDPFVLDMELAGFLHRKNASFTISMRSANNKEYDNVFIGSVQAGTKPMHAFLCVSLGTGLFESQEPNHWIYVPDVVVHNPTMSRRPSISKKSDLYTPPSKRSGDTPKPSLIKLPDFDKIIDVPTTKKQCYVDLANNIIYPFVPYAQKSTERTRNELRAMNPDYYEKLVDEDAHFDTPEPFLIAKILKLLSNLEDVEWTIAGGFYGEVAYMLPNSKSYGPGEHWMSNKKYREVYKDVPTTTQRDYVIAPFSLHSDKFDIPISQTKKCYAIIFEMNRFNQGVISFDEPSMGLEYYATQDVDYFYHPNELGKCRSHILKRLPLPFEFNEAYHKGIKYTAVAREAVADDIRITLCQLEASIPDFSNCLTQEVNKTTINSIIPRKTWRDVWTYDFLGLYSDIKLPLTRDPKHVAAITDYLNMKSAAEAAKENLPQAVLLSNGYRSVMNNQAKGITSQQVGLFLELYLNNLRQQERLESNEESLQDKVVRVAGLYAAKGVLAAYRYVKAGARYLVNHTGGIEAWRNAAILLSGGWYLKKRMVGGKFQTPKEKNQYNHGYSRGVMMGLCYAFVGYQIINNGQEILEELDLIRYRLLKGHALWDILKGTANVLLNYFKSTLPARWRDTVPTIAQSVVRPLLDPARELILAGVENTLTRIDDLSQYEINIDIHRRVGGRIRVAPALKIQSYLQQATKYRANITPSVPMAREKRAELDAYKLVNAVSLENPQFHLEKYADPVPFGEWMKSMAERPAKLSPQEPEYIGYARNNLFPSVQIGTCPSVRFV